MKKLIATALLCTVVLTGCSIDKNIAEEAETEGTSVITEDISAATTVTTTLISVKSDVTGDADGDNELTVRDSAFIASALADGSE